MTFDELHRDIDFCCITDDCREDTSTVFTRKLKGKEVVEYDFQSHWERKFRRPATTEKKKVCNSKSVSIHKNHSGIDNIYREIFDKKGQFKRKSINDNPPKKYCTFKLLVDAGVVIKGENRPPYHCGLFKSDSFSLSKINLISIEVFT